MSSIATGSVTVNPDGTWSGSGMALALMNALQPYMVAQIPSGPAAADIAIGCSNAAAGLATAIAAIAPYLVTNLKIQVPASAFASNVPNAEVDLSVK